MGGMGLLCFVVGAVARGNWAGVGECYVSDREKEEKRAFYHVSIFKPGNSAACCA